jgi:hypothetical protein
VKLFEELADISFGFELAEEFFAQHGIGNNFVTFGHNFMFLQI